ncbi:MAG: hypothetical protein GX955_00515 [Treponema sp.]|jgi:Holliday junction resolvase|nr:hypothetical protein [Treponema sp.]HQB57318.1 hypothetical protein [Candidatus Paceibacterota bacterium]HTO34947.1 hypothetical protein [Flavobacterium sp.]HUH44885.1 hypothetical protein [Treponemataceae bacterium]
MSNIIKHFPKTKKDKFIEKMRHEVIDYKNGFGSLIFELKFHAGEPVYLSVDKVEKFNLESLEKRGVINE